MIYLFDSRRGDRLVALFIDWATNRSPLHAIIILQTVPYIPKKLP